MITWWNIKGSENLAVDALSKREEGTNIPLAVKVITPLAKLLQL